MAIRSTMTDLVAIFRDKGNASTTDVFNSVTYWTDEQLEEILDETKTFVRVPIEAVDLGDTIFRLDIKRFYKLEEGYKVYNDSDEEVTDSQTYDINANYITFDAEQEEAEYVEGWVYNLYHALWELYDRKAAHREFYTEIKAGNTKQKLEQEYQQCINRRDYYRNKIARRVSRKRGSKWFT